MAGAFNYSVGDLVLAPYQKIYYSALILEIDNTLDSVKIAYLVDGCKSDFDFDDLKALNYDETNKRSVTSGKFLERVKPSDRLAIFTLKKENLTLRQQRILQAHELAKKTQDPGVPITLEEHSLKYIKQAENFLVQHISELEALRRQREEELKMKKADDKNLIETLQKEIETMTRERDEERKRFRLQLADGKTKIDTLRKENIGQAKLLMDAEVKIVNYEKEKKKADRTIREHENTIVSQRRFIKKYQRDASRFDTSDSGNVSFVVDFSDD